jgi:hypothetical protein
VGPATYLLGELDNLGRLGNSLLPEENDVGCFAGAGRERSIPVGRVLKKLVPDGNIDAATNALRNLAPFHVPAGLGYVPDDPAEAWDTLANVRQRDRASLGNECVGTGLAKKVD